MSIKTETFYTRSTELSSELLHGAIDIHVHAGPHLNSSPRRSDPFEAAEEAREAGMRAIVYMDVFSESCGTAWMVQRRVPGIEVYGGINLNSNYGGINPRAVKTALNYGAGAKFVQFGTHTTHFMASREARIVDGKPVLLKDLYPKFLEEEFSRAIRIPLDSVTPEIDEILTLIANSPGVYLNTGHVSGEEAMRLVDLAGTYGIKQVVIAEHALGELSVEQQKAAAKRVPFWNTLWPSLSAPGRSQGPTTMSSRNICTTLSSMSRSTGPIFEAWATRSVKSAPNISLSAPTTGYGRFRRPCEGMRMAAACFLDMDFPSADIQTMMCTNPAKLLSLE